MDMEGGPGRDPAGPGKLPGRRAARHRTDCGSQGQLHATASPGPAKGYYCQLLAACRLYQPPVSAGAPATLMLPGDRRPLARGQRTDHAPADPRSEPLICHGGRLALVLELKRLAAIVE